MVAMNGTRPDDRLSELVSLELASLDPYGLRPGAEGGAPANEYDLEARDIATLLRSKPSLSSDDIDRVWYDWFGESLTAKVGRERVTDLLLRLIRLK
ncbi:hypothetical protein [Blastococcus sp. Marseille-P5729]|uniref:hypothetical protein n=1 Tax=Blastococcus sp. Marseille-P5729 TaxID=2086582 RepID=UPI00131AFE92|nr:hypothetical protein [Blastococcus sp. Marseille-P5729]